MLQKYDERIAKQNTKEAHPPEPTTEPTLVPMTLLPPRQPGTVLLPSLDHLAAPTSASAAATSTPALAQVTAALRPAYSAAAATIPSAVLAPTRITAAAAVQMPALSTGNTPATTVPAASATSSPCASPVAEPDGASLEKPIEIASDDEAAHVKTEPAESPLLSERRDSAVSLDADTSAPAFIPCKKPAASMAALPKLSTTNLGEASRTENLSTAEPGEGLALSVTLPTPEDDTQLQSISLAQAIAVIEKAKRSGMLLPEMAGLPSARRTVNDTGKEEDGMEVDAENADNLSDQGSTSSEMHDDVRRSKRLKKLAPQPLSSHFRRRSVDELALSTGFSASTAASGRSSSSGYTDNSTAPSFSVSTPGSTPSSRKRKAAEVEEWSARIEKELTLQETEPGLE